MTTLLTIFIKRSCKCLPLCLLVALRNLQTAPNVNRFYKLVLICGNFSRKHLPGGIVLIKTIYLYVVYFKIYLITFYSVKELVCMSLFVRKARCLWCEHMLWKQLVIVPKKFLSYFWGLRKEQFFYWASTKTWVLWGALAQNPQ